MNSSRDGKEQTPYEAAIELITDEGWELAKQFHETYERLAPDFGYKTRSESAKPWSEVPHINAQLMAATCSTVLAALRSRLQEVEKERAATESALAKAREALTDDKKWFVEAIDHLLWAVDILDRYDARLVYLGDPKDLVYSNVHVNRKARARDVIEGAWQALHEGSSCSVCESGNVPLAGWHNRNDGDPIPCREYGTVAHPNLPQDEAVERVQPEPAPSTSVEPQVEPRIYAASRASVPARPAMWQKLRSEGVNIVSSWIDEAGPGQTADLGELWQRIEGEIRSADRLVLYAESDDFPLKGAYIEVGIALGLGKPIFVVMPDVTPEAPGYRPIGSWVKHPLVTVCRDVKEAVAADSVSHPPLEQYREDFIVWLESQGHKRNDRANLRWKDVASWAAAFVREKR